MKKKPWIETTGKGKFGAWLKNKLDGRNMTTDDLANKVHLNRVTISYHLNHKVAPSFPTVVAYCWAFDALAEIHEIWRLVEEDWA